MWFFRDVWRRFQFSVKFSVFCLILCPVVNLIIMTRWEVSQGSEGMMTGLRVFNPTAFRQGSGFGLNILKRFLCSVDSRTQLGFSQNDSLGQHSKNPLYRSEACSVDPECLGANAHLTCREKLPPSWCQYMGSWWLEKKLQWNSWLLQSLD